jgi:hypothetical protein
MTNFPHVPLETGWQVNYFEGDADVPGLYEFANSIHVPDLSDWQCAGRFEIRRLAWLQRGFDLEPITDVCLRYQLHVERAPAGTRIYVNMTLVGEFQTEPLQIDVTDYVMLEDNRIGLRVNCGAAGTFSGVVLRAVPCL